MSESTGSLWALLEPLRAARRPAVRSLWDAVKDGDLDLARRFIERGHEVDSSFPGGGALETAAGGGNLAMVRLLLDAGASMERPGSIGGPVTSAVSAGGDRQGVIEALMAAGPGAADLQGALRAVAFSGDGPTAAMVVAAARGAGVDEAMLEAACRAAAEQAVKRGNEQLAQFLRGESDDAGPNTDNLAADVSALLGGVDVNDEDAVAALLGLDDLFDDEPAPPPAAVDREALARELAQRIGEGEFDRELDGRDENGLSPLGFAGGHGLSGVLRALLAAGATADEGALAESARQGHLVCVELLLESGVAPDARSGVYTPLIDAAEKGHLDVVRVLLGAGANPRFRTKAGETAMQRASGLEVQAIRAALREYAPRFPSTTARGLKTAGKARDCDPARGIEDFLARMLAGHPEWVLVAARAPLDDVTATLVQAWSTRDSLTDVARRAVPEGKGVFAFQLEGHDWSLVPVEIGDYRTETAALADAGAPMLAARLSTTAIACYGEDTSASVGVTEFREDARTATLEWSDTLRYDGEGDPPAGEDGGQQLQRYFADLALFVPAMEIASDGFDRQLVLRHVPVGRVARVDYLVLD